MEKIEEYKVFASELEHFENDMHFWRDIWYNTFPDLDEARGGELQTF